MFKKPETSKAPVDLANRLKAIAAKPALEEAAYEDLKVRNGRPRREATFKQATIRLSTGERVDVVVKNVSDTGARIDFFKKTVLSDKIQINEPTLRIKCWARVMWQTEGAAGLQFIRD